MRFFYTAVLMVLLTANRLRAQPAVLEGRLQTNADEVSMQLFAETGTPLMRGFSDSAGCYSFPVQRGRRYVLRASAPGYTDAFSDTIRIDRDTVWAPVLLLQPLQALKGVTVKTAPMRYEMRPDRLVMHVEQNPVAAGSTVFQLLQQSPGVSTDQEDRLLMKGAGAAVYINGRPAFLGGHQLTEYLKTLPADQVASVELITQPSGRYDAAGTAGIINILLKKNKAYGTNGILSLGGGTGRYPKANGGLSLNYRRKHLNLFGNVNPGYSESYNKLNYNSTIAGNDSTIYQDRENYWRPKTSSLTYSGGADYYINTNSVLGLLVNGERTNAPAVTDNSSVFRNAALMPYQYIDSRRTEDGHSHNVSYNLNYKLTTDSNRNELILNADYGRYSSRSTEMNENVFRDAAGGMLRRPYTFRQLQPSDIRLCAATADFTRRLRGSGRLELGVKYSLVSSDNDLTVDSAAQDDWVRDAGRSNHFQYREQIVAGYVNWARAWKGVVFQIGLRGEQTDGRGHSITLGAVNSFSYFGLFPTAYLSRKIDSNQSLTFSYGRRINRPAYQSLNPFTFYLDPSTRFAGNPYLQPSYAHSFELRHSCRQILFTTLSYRYSRGDAVMTIQQDAATGRVTNMTRNAGSSQYLGLEIFSRQEPRSWWTIESSLTLAATHSRSEIPGYSYDARALTAYANTSHSFALAKELRLQVSLYGSAPSRDGLARLRGAYGLSFGAEQGLWHQRATIRISVSNIIGINAYRAHYFGEGLDIRWRNEWEGRKISLSFDYRFGSKQIKAARERKTASDEKNRIGI